MRLRLYFKNVDQDGKIVYLDETGRSYYGAGYVDKETEIFILDADGEKKREDRYDFDFIPRYMSNEFFDKMYSLIKSCPCCGSNTPLYMNEEEENAYQLYLQGVGNIQDMLSGFTKQERELLITQYCYKCQSEIFGKYKLKRELKFECRSERKIAHNRFDHDGYRWHNKWFIQNGTGGNEEIISELEEFSDFMTNLLNRGRSDIKKVCDYYDVSTIGNHEYNLFASGEYCNFFVRLIDRSGDYHMYIYCYLRADFEAPDCEMCECGDACERADISQ